jgi:hypothetical protein
VVGRGDLLSGDIKGARLRFNFIVKKYLTFKLNHFTRHISLQINLHSLNDIRRNSSCLDISQRSINKAEDVGPATGHI